MTIRPIFEKSSFTNPEEMKQFIKDFYGLDWIFHTWLEKGIVIVCFLWSLFSLIKFIWIFIGGII